MTHVPYKGVAPAITDLIAKTIDVVFGPVTNLLSNSDRLSGLAISAPARSAAAASAEATCFRVISYIRPEYDMREVVLPCASRVSRTRPRRAPRTGRNSSIG